MAEAIEAIDGPFEALIELYERSHDTPLSNDAISPIPATKEKVRFAALEMLSKEQHHMQESSNQKLTTIQAILSDQIVTVETTEDKQIALEGVLTGDFSYTNNSETNSFSESEEKLNQIEAIIRDRDKYYSHPHEKFACIEAILGDHSKSANPWVQAHKSLCLVEESSRHIIRAEEKRHKELRELWRTGMCNKAKHYTEMADSQRWWRNASIVMLIASGTLPMLAKLPGLLENAQTAEIIAIKINPYIGHIKQLKISDLQEYVQISGRLGKSILNKTAELIDKKGTQTIEFGTQISKLEKQDKETLLDWETQQERQALETQQQLIQEARQNDNSLKERHLEVIKTLTNMIVGR
ncbi:MAG: hypothetical protein KDK59_04790 [Simkania sp.]|nr:hypothetical protein [Simkania sp.]